MTPEQHAALRIEIATDPRKLGYAAFLPDDPTHAADLLNAQTESMVKSRYITARTIMAECDASDAILAGLKAAASANAQVECAWNFINRDSGLDLGNPKTLVMCDQLAVQGVWTVEQAEQVKVLATQPASRAEVLGLGFVTARDIIDSGAI